MTWKSPIGGYRSPFEKRRKRKSKPAFVGREPRPRPKCGQGIVNGDERYCPGCGRTWPKNEEHP